jgi:hypothetical protein
MSASPINKMTAGDFAAALLILINAASLKASYK